MVRVVDRVEDIFHSYAGPSGGVDMKAVFRLLWSTMGNSVSLVDVAGVFAVSIPTSSNNSEVLSQEIFQDFFRAFSRLKYPMGSDFCEKMLDEIRHVKGSKPHLDTGILSAVADKNVVRVFLKYDLPLRRAFSTFCGQAMRVGAVVSWDEVKVLSLGMEVTTFILPNLVCIIIEVCFACSWMDLLRLQDHIHLFHSCCLLRYPLL